MLIILALILGVVMGLLLPVRVPSTYTIYIAAFILASLNSILSGIIAETEERFSFRVFIYGLLVDFLFAISLMYISKKVGFDLTLAVGVVFCIKLFQKISVIRRYVLQKSIERVKIEVTHNNDSYILTATEEVDIDIEK